MAQNITLLGASYSDVPAVNLPKTGGGTARFTDATITTAVESDVAQGKVFVKADGSQGTGTATGGGGIDPGQVYQDANGYLVLDDDPGSNIIVEALSATQNGTYTAPTGTAYSPVTVNVSGGGGGGGDMSDPIRFFDYDGTLVASYSSVPATLPGVPIHDKLTNGTWNYTLAQVTAQFNAMGTCDVGANYDTVSGATEIDIELPEGRLHPYLSLAVNGTVTIDWGDNSTSTASGTSLTARLSTIYHEYAIAGSYTIKITKTSGTGYSLYCTSVYTLLNNGRTTSGQNRVYANSIRAVRIGEDCSIGDYAFDYCSLESISIPSGITSIGNYAFQYCYSLVSASIPSTVTSIGSSAFQYCYSLVSASIPSSVTSISGGMFSTCGSLVSVSIPSSVTSIGNSAFYGCSSLSSLIIPSAVTSIGTYALTQCYSLESVVILGTIASLGDNAFAACQSLKSVNIPNGVTSIGAAFSNCHSLVSISIPSTVTSIAANAFSNCYGMAEYHFEPTTPPTLANKNSFNNIQGDCIIYVPAASLEAYQTANNWSTYASYMVGE